MNALPGIIAVHVFLAKHVELAELPLAWMIETDGTIQAQPDYRAPGGHDAVRALAKALRAKTDERIVGAGTDSVDKVVQLAWNTKLSGLLIQSSAYEQVTA